MAIDSQLFLSNNLPEGLRFWDFEGRRIFDGRNRETGNLRSTLIFIIIKGESPSSGDFGGPGFHKEGESSWYVTEMPYPDIINNKSELIPLFREHINIAVEAIKNGH